MGIPVNQLFKDFPAQLLQKNDNHPWLIIATLADTLLQLLPGVSDDYVLHNNIAMHKTAKVESGAVLKGPGIIGKDCFIGAGAYVRGGVYLGNSVVIGPGCEVKTCIILDKSHLAHFNFVGDSIIGSRVNFEAGAVICNHWNERAGKKISLAYNGQLIETGIDKFGALVGDESKIGANAVLSPGTVLVKNSIVKRLELVEQT